ncbi:MAG: flagellar hook protein [Pseudobutyrivibrio sp.]|nr:flagellar hook protein [Pseudobutyrivibrio sp.]
MEDGDVSAWELGNNDGKIQMAELKARALNPNDTSKTSTSNIMSGDTITVDGITTYCVGDAYTPTKVEDVAKAIGALEAGSIVKVADIDGNNLFEYTIVENAKQEKPEQSMLTRESIVALLEEGQDVSLYDKNNTLITGKQFTVAEVEPDEEGTISTKKAYQLMATELERASSIGTDNGATVLNNMDGTFTIKQGQVTYADVLNFNLHVGADADMTNKIGVTIETMTTANLGIRGLNVEDADGISATYAIDAISDALAKVSAQRSALGAIQNRLEHSIANLDNVVENSEAAESRIRDTDMAEEMVTYSKNNILAQAGQSMLAQANQSTQGVMSILQ